MSMTCITTLVSYPQSWIEQADPELPDMGTLRILCDTISAQTAPLRLGWLHQDIFAP